MKAWALLLLLAAVATIGCGSRQGRVRPAPPSPAPAVFDAPTASSSIAVDSLGERIWVANTERNTLSFLSVERDVLIRLREIPVQREPTCLALSPDDLTVYVTNRGSGTVTVVSAATLEVLANIPVGTEPVGCALTPLGDKLYVACSISKTIAVVDTASRSVASTLVLTDGFFPFAVAVTSKDAAAHKAEKVYVTQYFGQLPVGQRPGRSGDDDVSRFGKVTVIDASTDRLLRTVTLAPHSSGFTANRTAFGGSATQMTTAFPNLLSTVVVRGSRGYVLHSAQSPQGPIAFDTNVQPFLSVFDTATDQEVTTAALNFNVAVRAASPQGPFLNVPWGLAIRPGGRTGLALFAGSDVAVQLAFSADGTPTATMAGGAVLQIPVGKNPRALALNRTGTRAYVHNYLGRNVTVLDLVSEAILGTVTSASLPTTGTLEASILHGEELFNTSRGAAAGTTATGRMSTHGRGSCLSCHPFGWTDTVVWNFEDGPRKTPSLASVFERTTGRQKLLNASATRDEVADFERNIRLVSGDPAADGQTGLIVGAPLSDVPDLLPRANDGRSADWTDLANYLRFGLRSPISPWLGTNVSAGRTPFATAGCPSCHGGPHWTSSRLTYTPPPVTGAVEGRRVASALKAVDTYLAGEVDSRNQTALSSDSRFNPPSLKGFWAFPPHFHNGQAATVDEVLTRVLNTRAHRDAGVPGRLENPADRAALVRFLESIDDSTTPEVVP
ncbi:MAG: hypothetical protein HY814_15145 [Candidatus Riflebacteria bacterium]|nr:hypothetical protein [Candidatus Riflebacteria bacterium]